MKKIILAAIAATIAAPIWAQSAVDAYNLSQSQTRGTARFMSMGGAFTALGGDLSTLNQNPAGIGVYRRSEIGATLDISPSSFTTKDAGQDIKMNKTTVACNNFGYVGAVRLPGALRNFNWGVSYARVASFDRTYQAYVPRTYTSLTNYIANYTSAKGVSPNALDFDGLYNGYNPYLDVNNDGQYNDWLSVLAYTSSMISPGYGGYVGLYQPGTVGDAQAIVHEKGYVDEYNIDFGGNINDVVYWGLGFGITDLSFTRSSEYSESMDNALVPIDNKLVSGTAGYYLDNYQHISGSGWNFKIGLIFRPINELRIGVAVHTPTWYSLSQSATGYTDYSYFDPNQPEQTYDPADPDSFSNPYKGTNQTDNSYYNFKLRSPWKFMVGAAGVIGNSAIISLDYERQAFGDMKVKYQDDWGYYVDDDAVNGDVKNYFKATNIIRLGLEYRLSSHVSARAGYSYATTNVKDSAADGTDEIYTSGTNPAYTLDDDTYSISAGLGYRYKGFTIDAAYVYRHRSGSYHAFTDFDGIQAPQTKLDQSTNSIVLSVGYRF